MSRKAKTDFVDGNAYTWKKEWQDSWQNVAEGKARADRGNNL